MFEPETQCYGGKFENAGTAENAGTFPNDQQNEDQVGPAGAVTGSKLKLTPAAELKAIENYAEANGLSQSAVTIDLVESDSEGVMYWANKKEDISARGAVGQQFNRAVAKAGKWAVRMQDLHAFCSVLGLLSLAFLKQYIRGHIRELLLNSL